MVSDIARINTGSCVPAAGLLAMKGRPTTLVFLPISSGEIASSNSKERIMVNRRYFILKTKAKCDEQSVVSSHSRGAGKQTKDVQANV